MGAVSKMNRFALSVGLFLLGGLSGYFFSEIGPENPSLPEESSDIFRALVLSSNLLIPKQKLSCEAGGPLKHTTAGIAFPDTKIVDYLVSYLLWSQARTRNSANNFSCEGGTIKNCTWGFGESQSIEGWGRILKFEYNAAVRSIVPGSLECIDVP